MSILYVRRREITRNAEILTSNLELSMCYSYSQALKQNSVFLADLRAKPQAPAL